MVANERRNLAAVASAGNRRRLFGITRAMSLAGDFVEFDRSPKSIFSRNTDKFFPPDKQVLIAVTECQERRRRALPGEMHARWYAK